MYFKWVVYILYCVCRRGVTCSVGFLFLNLFPFHSFGNELPHIISTLPVPYSPLYWVDVNSLRSISHLMEKSLRSSSFHIDPAPPQVSCRFPTNSTNGTESSLKCFCCVILLPLMRSGKVLSEKALRLQSVLLCWRVCNSCIIYGQMMCRGRTVHVSLQSLSKHKNCWIKFEIKASKFVSLM